MCSEQKLEETEKPLLTIAIPTYNRAWCLKDLLSALADQVKDEPRIELIISDNASTDETPLLVKDFVAEGHRVRYLRNAENIGSDANFVQCFEQARGKYVWLFSDDDIIIPGALAKILSYCESAEYDPAPRLVVRQRIFELDGAAQVGPGRVVVALAVCDLTIEHGSGHREDVQRLIVEQVSGVRSWSDSIFQVYRNESRTALVDLYSLERIRPWTVHPGKIDCGAAEQYRRLQALPGFWSYPGYDHERLAEVGEPGSDCHERNGPAILASYVA